MLRFTSPPMPHFIVGGEDTYPVGGMHASRSRIGVFDLIAVTRGALHMEEEGEARDVPAGHYVILRPDFSHRTHRPCSEETHFYWLHFQTLGSWNETDERFPFAASDSGHPYATIEAFSFYLSTCGPLPGLMDVPELMRRLNLLQAHHSAAARWEQQQLFLELLLLLQRETSRPADSPHYAVAEKTAAYLRSHYREEIDYRMLAEAVHYHGNYIALCMKRAYGCTPLEYLTKHRVERAKQLLIHTDAKIGGIAEETGFGSFPYFVRCFARHVGMTPKAFRNRHRVR